MGFAMNDLVGSHIGATDARIHCRLVEVDGCLRVETGVEEHHHFDLEEVLHLVKLALESERELRIGRDGYAR